MKITFATWNAGKFEEVKRQFVWTDIEILQEKVDLLEIQTNSLEEIATFKAIQAFQKVKEPVFVDDTWVFFEAYNNFPGVFAKFMYESLWIKGFAKLLNWTNKRWYFKTIIAYMDENLEKPVLFEWITYWYFDLSGIEDWKHQSLPYNYIFVPDWLWTTVAKNYKLWQENFSHRQKAVKKFKEYLT